MSRWSPPVFSAVLTVLLLFVPSVLSAQVVCSPQPPGPPPVLFSPQTSSHQPRIIKASVTAGPSDGHAVCDVTGYFKGLLCASGVPATDFPAFPTLALDVLYTSARIEAKVQDPDSRGDQSDILLVSAEYQRSTGTGCEVLVLQDDGGSAEVSFPQTAPTPEACDLSSDCPICTAAVYPVRSNDRKAGDGTYTAEQAFLSGTVEVDAPAGVLPGAQTSLAADCIAAANAQLPTIGARSIGEPIPFRIETVDRAGNLTLWPEEPSIDLQQTHVACSGDECACCLMLSGNPPTECAGRAGLVGVPGSGFESGLCHTF